MKRRLVMTLATVALVLGTVAPASAHEYDRRDSGGHPWRWIVYVIHPVGVALEYVVARPIHSIASRGELDILMGHKSYVADDDTYFTWEHGDSSPSISDVRDARKKEGLGMVK